MRWYIVRTLLEKEVRRQLANRGGLLLAGLLVAAAILMNFFRREGEAPGVLGGGAERCFVDYWVDDDWVQYLRAHVPSALVLRIRFRTVQEATSLDGVLYYPSGSGAIQMRAEKTSTGATTRKVSVWYPGEDTRALAAYEIWFWRETARFHQHKTDAQRNASVSEVGAGTVEPTAAVEDEQSHLKGGADMGSAVTVGLVLFALFFSCVYLLPSLMCEERERGILLAQALSPASALEILAAKFLFYPAAGLSLAAILAGVSRPEVLTSVFFWLAICAAAVGSLGIGLTIACVARTQRTASMGALCYMLVVTLLLFIFQQTHLSGLSYLAVEFHCPRMLHAALTDTVRWYHWGNLVATGLLAAGWCGLAAYLFRTRGWQ